MPAAAEIHEVLGRYRLERRLASGGMGTVFEAQDLERSGTVAVKVLDPQLQRDEQVVARFRQEARIMMAVSHPHIVRTFDLVEQEAPPRVAIAMELLKGSPLDETLRRQAFDPLEAIEAAQQLTAALAVVHGHGFIHRDLKPQNVMVDRRAAVRLTLLDFGIAKNTSPGKGPKTAAGLVMGTPAYMAPEQLAGTGVSYATDVYALGELLFEMLTGTRLFDFEQEAILRMKMLDRHPDVVLPFIPCQSELTRLIRSALHPEPERRPSLSVFRRTLAAVRDLMELANAFDDQTQLDPDDLDGMGTQVGTVEPQAGLTQIPPNHAATRVDSTEAALDASASTELPLPPLKVGEPKPLHFEGETVSSDPSTRFPGPVFMPAPLSQDGHTAEGEAQPSPEDPERTRPGPGPGPVREESWVGSTVQARTGDPSWRWAAAGALVVVLAAALGLFAVLD